MTRAVRFHAAARMEFVEAAAWYDAQRSGLGSAFIAEIEDCLQRAAVDPTAFAVCHRDLRRAVAHRFPYCVYFREDAEGIFVFAVFHASRAPMVWQQRS
jgi:plasmid stabilization system protein ParE